MGDIIYEPWKMTIAFFFDFIVGALWFSPVMFSKPWMKAVGIKKEDAEKHKDVNVINLLLLQASINALTILIHTYLMVHLNPETLSECLIMSFLVWVGFTASAIMGPILWEGKPINYFLINSSWRLLSVMVYSFFYFITSSLNIQSI